MNCVYVCCIRLFFICRHKWLYIAVIALNISLLLQEMYVPFETLLMYKRIVTYEMLTLAMSYLVNHFITSLYKTKRDYMLTGTT